jgi:hypothetical protein
MMLHHREVPGSSSAKPDFGRFLYSQVWIEPSGMALSVVSALARLNLDPGREAFRLATIPRTAAALTLATAIARLPDPPAAIDISDTAARLIKLLPDLAAVAPPAGADATTWRPPARWWVRAARTWQLWLIAVLAGAVIYLSLASGPAGDAKNATQGGPAASGVRSPSPK